MICNCNGIMSPLFSSFYQCRSTADSIHIAHLSMQMQFNALFWRIVHTNGQRSVHHITHHDDCFFGKSIVLAIASHDDAHTFFNLGEHLFHRCFFFCCNGWWLFLFFFSRVSCSVIQKGFAFDGVCKVCNGKGEQYRFPT